MRKLPLLSGSLRFVLLSLGVLMLAAGCKEASTTDLTQMTFQETITVLKEHFDQAPFEVVDLDAVPVEVAYAEWAVDEVSTEVGDLFIGIPEAMVIIGDSLYICDTENHAILVADRQGRLHRRIGRPGQGPGEFLKPASIAANSRYVFVYDHGNRRIQIFDHRFSYVPR